MSHGLITFIEAYSLLAVVVLMAAVVVALVVWSPRGRALAAPRGDE